MALVAPSLLAANFGCLFEQIALVENAGADWLHFDIMDGHFVPNLSYGADLVRQMRPHSKLFFDVHLMVEEPLNFLPMFEKCGADQVTVHYEACSDLSTVIRWLKARGIKVGVSLKPQTNAEVLIPFLDNIDNVLIMTVEPGFGGQKFMADMLAKIGQARRLIGPRKITLEVDGGINAETAVKCVAEGADILVAGSAVFKAENPKMIINQLQHTGERSWQRF